MMLILGKGVHEAMKCTKYICEISTHSHILIHQRSATVMQDATAYARPFNLRLHDDFLFAYTRRTTALNYRHMAFRFDTVSRFGWLRCVQAIISNN